MISAVIPLPQGLEFPQWAALFAEALAELQVQAPSPDQPWQEWGESLFYSPQLAFLPEPRGFSDWQEWASRVLETIF